MTRGRAGRDPRRRGFPLFPAPFPGPASGPIRMLRGFSVASTSTGLSGIAERYATALFELADERKTLDQVAVDLKVIRVMLAESDDLIRLLSSPALIRDEHPLAMSAVLFKPAAPVLPRSFVCLLLSYLLLSIVLSLFS